MRQVRYRAVISLDPAEPASVAPRHWHWHHRHQGPLPVPYPYPRSAAQTGPGARGLAAGPVAEAGREYLNHTRDLMVRAESRDAPGRYRSFPAELTWDDEMPLHPGDRHVVTVTLTDDDAVGFFVPGQRFTLWNGAEVGHGTLSRQMFSYTEYGPF